MIIHRCDKCGLDSPQKSGELAKKPIGWTQINYNVNPIGNVNNVNYELCTKCRDELKIPDDYNEKEQDIGNRLLEILNEIVEAHID